MKINRAIISPILFIIAFFIFVVLDVGLNIEKINRIIQPFFFAVTLTIDVLFTYLRKYLLICSIVLLIFMVIIYLFQMLVISDWVGSLGFGMLFITIFSYIPQVIKKGYIEKF